MKVLIIDDDYNSRTLIYDKIIPKYFETNIARTKIQAESLICENCYDLIVCDYSLDGNYNARDILDVMKQNNNITPCILVSDKWVNSKGEQINRISEITGKFKNVIQFISMENINTCDENCLYNYIKNINEMIEFSFLKYTKHIFNSKDANEKISFLHFSDIQIGGEISEFATGIQSSIPQYLINNNKNIDFSVISGDVLESGKKNERRNAEMWFNNFGKNLWPHRYNEYKYCFVNGNHDCEFSAFAKSHFKYDFNNKKFKVKGNMKYSSWDAYKEYRNLVNTLCKERNRIIYLWEV